MDRNVNRNKEKLDEKVEVKTITFTRWESRNPLNAIRIRDRGNLLWGQQDNTRSKN